MTLFLRPLLLLLLLLTPAAAHETTRSYLSIAHDQAVLSADVSLALRDLEVAVWLDADLDGRITWEEAEARLPAITAYLMASLSFEAGGPCTLMRTGTDVTANGGVDYLQLSFTATCPDAEAPLTLRSRLFAELDPDHRLFLTATAGGRATTSVLGPQTPSVTLALGADGPVATFFAYVLAGIEHLAGGADHIVFLIVLMLPAIASTASARTAAIGVLMAATGFTIAHALTLTAATLQVLRPRSDVIEVLVAMSIIITAADNIRPFLPAPRAIVSAFFGLIHGFGFATVLGGLKLSSGALATALLGFNIGIEIAQVGIILGTMPALYMLRAGRWLVWTGSAPAIAIGIYWCALRVVVWV